MKNKVRVTICGKEYSLLTDEAPSYLTKLAKEVDTKISEMTNSSDSVSTLSAAVLVALDSLDSATKANESIDNIRTQIKDYVDEAGRARMERDEAVKQRDATKKELELTKTKLSCFENDRKLKKLKDSI